MELRVALAWVLLVSATYTTFAEQPGKTMRAAGRVVAVATESITIKPGANNLTLSVDSSTKITGKDVAARTRALKTDQRSATVSDLVDEHDSVVVKYRDAGGGKLYASEIDVRMKAFKKQ